MRQFLRNTPPDAGQIALPTPTPGGFYREIQILGRIINPALGGVTLYSVTTEGDLFQALFVVGESSRAWPLVNRVDPAAFQQEMSNAYVDAVNALLDREEVAPASAEEALKLGRFVVEVFYNFDYRYTPASVDSLTFAELNLVRVLESIDEIPQGLRRFDTEGGNALLYGKIPDRVRNSVTPPRVRSDEASVFDIAFYSWHPKSGELKRWEIRLAGGQFESLKDQTVEKWASFTQAHPEGAPGPPPGERRHPASRRPQRATNATRRAGRRYPAVPQCHRVREASESAIQSLGTGVHVRYMGSGDGVLRGKPARLEDHQAGPCGRVREGA
jgi:hypothetical protein